MNLKTTQQMDYYQLENVQIYFHIQYIYSYGFIAIPRFTNR